MGQIWVWLTRGGCGWNLWVLLVGMVVRRHIDFLILLIPTPIISATLLCFGKFITLCFKY